MYQALYRKYRPSCFNDVVGQEHITDILKNELKTGKIFHAYLFTGPRGTGKTSCAKILAKAVNCLESDSGDACLECASCKAIENGDVLDIVEIDAASNNGVENIRDLKEQVNYTPTSSKYRVYIIDEVHMLSIGAFNALLKTLEEPPAHIVFILATTEVHKLPATILSRCQRFDFHRISSEAIANRITYIAEKEGFEIERSAADMIASLCDGGMRDALSTLDLCAARTRHITEQDVYEVCSLAGSNYCLELSSMIAEGDTGAALSKIDELHKNAVDISRLCSELITHYRDLMIAKTVKDPSGLIVCAPKELEELKGLATRISIESITNAITVLADALDRMTASDRRTELEMAIVKLCTPQLDSSPSALLARLEKLERLMKYSAAPTASAAQPETPAAKTSTPLPTAEDPLPAAPPTPAPAAADDTPEDDTTDDVPPPIEDELPPESVAEPEPAVPPAPAAATSKPAGTADNSAAVRFDAWQDILAELLGTAPLLAASLNGSKAYVNGDLLLIDSENPQFFSLMRNENPMYRNQIKAALQTVVGRSYRLGPYKKAAESTNDPLQDIISKLKQLEVPED